MCNDDNKQNKTKKPICVNEFVFLMCWCFGKNIQMTLVVYKMENKQCIWENNNDTNKNICKYQGMAILSEECSI